MSFADSTIAIVKRMDNQWTQTDVAKPNVPYNPPTDRDQWVRITVLPGTSEPFCLNGPNGAVYEYPGVIMGQIFTKEGMGFGSAMKLADAFAGVFNQQNFNGVQCKSASFTHVGAQDGWYQLNVSVPYYYHE